METAYHRSGPKGILNVVGTGPGSLDYLIPAARQAIEDADIIIGYKTYLALIKDITGTKKIMPSAMMQEVDRVKKAINLAEEGYNIALISGGDPGIYAMAGLVYEVARETDSTVEIRIIAGIAALNSCAERLGAPLMHDFATISLSDLLTPWDLIEKRIKAAAAADFVLVVYNPKSRKRDWQLKKMLEIVAQYREKHTPVGMVKASTRESEEVILSTLEFFNSDLVDMQTTVIIGNSNSFQWNGKMITPRGYKDKYQLD